LRVLRKKLKILKNFKIPQNMENHYMEVGKVFKKNTLLVLLSLSLDGYQSKTLSSLSTG
jgi:hypothetical protein